MSGNLGYACATCPFTTLDDGAANEHEDRTGHPVVAEVWR